MKTPTPVESDKKPTLYIACKLCGAEPPHLHMVSNIIELLKLKDKLTVLPFAFDFETMQPTGERSQVLDHDLKKVEEADYMVVLLLGDVSDGRGMEVMHRMSLSRQKRNRTLILREQNSCHSPFYDGLHSKYGVSIKDLVWFTASLLENAIVNAIEEWQESMATEDFAWRESNIVSQGPLVSLKKVS